MPLEIRELVIKAVVGDESPTQGTVSNSTGSNENDQASLIQTCVERVLEIIRESTER